MDRENREETREEVPVKKRGRKARGKGRKQTARERRTGVPLQTLGLADITRHALERDPGGRCCNLNFPEGSSSAAPGKNNNTWSVSRTAHRNVARGTRAGCQPNASARTFDLLNSNNNTYSFSRAACSGKLAPLQDAALRCATQACSVRGSRQGPRRTPRDAVRLTAKPYVRSESVSSAHQ